MKEKFVQKRKLYFLNNGSPNILKMILVIAITMLFSMQSTFTVYAETVVSTAKSPDYDIWMADTLIDGINGDGVGSWYKTFQDLSDPVYKTLGAELLNDKPLVNMSAAWSVLFNEEYRSLFSNEQKYIYEIILMDYLKYGTSLDSANALSFSSEFNFSKELYSSLAEELSDNTIDYINNDLPIEKAKKIWKNAKVIKGLDDVIEKFDKGTKTVKELIEEISRYKALKNAKENKITLLKASKTVASNNKNYCKAVDDIVKALESTDLSYVSGRSLNYLLNRIFEDAWDVIVDTNPVLRNLKLGVAGLDACFDTTNAASNNLKLALLYTVDSYMRSGMVKAAKSYQSAHTSSRAIKFQECFEGYVQFQMFGNTYAKNWLGHYLNGGVVKDLFNQFFKKENIKTAKNLQTLCNKQTNGRQKVLNGIIQYSEIYQGQYAITEEVKSQKATIKLSAKNVTMVKDTNKTLTAKVTGKSKKVTWSSSNKSVATVKNGKVTAKKKGTAIITAKANGKTAKCKITVTNPSIKLNKKSATIYTIGNNTLQLKATVKGASSKIIWKSSNKNVATVSSKGLVKARKTGTVTITAKANGETAKCKVTIIKIPSNARYYNGHYYMVYNYGYTWERAKAFCESKGGHLATITTIDEADFIRSLPLKKNYYWLGGTDRKKEGVWKWITGEKWNYTNWAIPQPDNYSLIKYNAENYLQLCVNNNFWWNDANVTTDDKLSESGFICEWG